jgi:heme oxygenase
MRTEVRPLILDKLKQSTRIHHDRASKSVNILHAHLSIEEYRDILQKLWGFYKPLEAVFQLRIYPAKPGSFIRKIGCA